MKPREETFAQIVGDYVQEKRATGYRFDKGSQMLRRIVDIQEEIDHGSPRLSRELVEWWIEKTPWENETNRSHRISVLRGLGVYMVRMQCHKLSPKHDEYIDFSVCYATL